MGVIKAIETKYAGCNFRSRLEARWAVYWDALGITWEYEKEGYDLGEAGWYLPDFWLPSLNTWVEVKPGWLNTQEQHKAFALVEGLGYDLLMASGVPTQRHYGVVSLMGDESGLAYIDTVAILTAEDYLYNEHRFYWSCECGGPGPCTRATDQFATTAATSARFERGWRQMPWYMMNCIHSGRDGGGNCGCHTPK